MSKGNRQDIFLGAAIIIAAIALWYLIRGMGAGANVSLGGIDLIGDMSLPSGNAPGADVSASVETFQQTATSPDGKFAHAVGGASLYILPPSSL